jgi:sialate O-acetylesterase
MPTLRLLTALFALAATASTSIAGGEPEWMRVVDLSGAWHFRIGDDPAWATASYDHSAWEPISVPGAWEDAGYWGYDGLAWYRRSFRLTQRQLREPLYLHLGRIDDVDHVWINGRFVGSTGRFPESEYETAYFAHRAYRVPPGFLQPGENVVAVRVFDEGLEGGILEGSVGLFTLNGELDLALDLSGTWHFRPGDDPGFRTAPTVTWATVTVPAKWEPQGFPDLDGVAWYRRRFSLPDRLRGDPGPEPGQDLVLVLGRIDDLHEVFLNGERIGGTPGIERGTMRGDEWSELRTYRIPRSSFRTKNELAVRVFDGWRDGGIYQGPIGLMTESAFERWQSGGGLMDRIRAFFGLGE